MIEYLFTFLFILPMIPALQQCSNTRCYSHFSPSQCPKDTYAHSWSYCAFNFGRYEFCCSRTSEQISSSHILPMINIKSPRVKRLVWGEVQVEGINDSFKDVKLFPGGAHSWNWRETNTRHQPGIQPADLRELFEKNCEIIILSRGIQNMLYTKDETRTELERRGMKRDTNYFILQSEKAVQLYNQYVDEEKRVCAVIHSTC